MLGDEDFKGGGNYEQRKDNIYFAEYRWILWSSLMKKKRQNYEVYLDEDEESKLINVIKTIIFNGRKFTLKNEQW